jgi:hypothetical protein
MKDLIVTFVTFWWEKLYIHKAIKGRRKNFSYFYPPSLSKTEIPKYS